MSKSKQAMLTGFTFVFVHTLLLSIFTLFVWRGMRESPEAEAAWNLWLIIDFPSSLLAIPLDILLGPRIRGFGVDSIVARMFYPAIYGVLGAVQYFLLGYWLSKRFKKDAPITVNDKS